MRTKSENQGILAVAISNFCQSLIVAAPMKQQRAATLLHVLMVRFADPSSKPPATVLCLWVFVAGAVLTLAKFHVHYQA